MLTFSTNNKARQPLPACLATTAREPQAAAVTLIDLRGLHSFLWGSFICTRPSTLLLWSMVSGEGTETVRLGTRENRTADQDSPSGHRSLPARSAVNTKTSALTSPRRNSCGRHSRPSRATMLSSAQPPAMARRSTVDPRAMPTSTQSSHTCRNRAC